MFRRTTALEVGNGLFKIEATPDYDPNDETWEFVPGSDVRVEMGSSTSGQHLIAVKP